MGRSRVSAESLLEMVKQTIQIFARVKPSVRKQQQGVRAAGSGVGRVGAQRGGAGRGTATETADPTVDRARSQPQPRTWHRCAHLCTCTCLHTHLCRAPSTHGRSLHSSRPVPTHPQPCIHSLELGMMGPQWGNRSASIVMHARRWNRTITDKRAHVLSLACYSLRDILSN